MKKCRRCKKELTDFDKGNFLCSNCKKNLIEKMNVGGRVTAFLALAAGLAIKVMKNKDE